MSASVDKLAVWQKLSFKEKKKMLEDEFGLPISASPYLPRMSNTSGTFAVPYAINSAGLSGLQNLIGSRRVEAWTSVREACFVSVRDRGSSQTLRKAGVEHTLAPDLVHTLRDDPDFRPDAQPDLALIQVKGAVLRRIGTHRFAQILSESKSLKPYRLRLFAAGYATGHDSYDLYEEVVQHFASMNTSRDISMPLNGTALEKAQEIAGCGLWIGTSLHGWIISSSFNRARVAVELEKIVRYSNSWEDPMPAGVQVVDIEVAIQDAIAKERRGDSAEFRRSESIAKMADASVRSALSRLASDVPKGEVERRSETHQKLLARSKNPLHAVLDSFDFRRSN
ncbi:polysaccharide pyruvyl transferase family protein [Rhodococcus sp. IEGM 1330]|uniref:polysaccharide pyruvyl transferase family protein n=1 Tax=Rhodococcus sp. IEGM 1330 TaxID=3082225 RepID=UPI0029547499|nr:polysaccharide pyruvyl transferase family protein [Rhodococcus sp. IEGM 1330]MDV8023652.1 polysaccharide pyruvyl transferase family protein [Rhodococcus sp. IEGM 1330]